MWKNLEKVIFFLNIYLLFLLIFLEFFVFNDNVLYSFFVFGIFMGLFCGIFGVFLVLDEIRFFGVGENDMGLIWSWGLFGVKEKLLFKFIWNWLLKK